ncbi:Ankyrin-1 [Trichoderma lentiforme]|uniref:Ankyrin-1 n=1 Tax=Trichoderma lentiforme TaxID=1567552 RepID=A0A9P5CD41_9HYPO|nr:Ankyrin-1 [Trichoderma lentiforme]
MSIKRSADALPDAPFKIYYELLNNIPDQSRQMLQNVIHWLAHSYRPLNLSELAIVAVFDQKNENLDVLGDSTPIDLGWDLQNALGNLVRIEGDHTVHMDDQFRRFILEKVSPKEPKMASYGYQDHSSVAYMCLKYISLFIHDGSIQSSNSDFGGDLLLYAIRYWPEHYKKGKIDIEPDSDTKLSAPEGFVPLLSNYSLIQAWARQYAECKTQRRQPESDHPLCVAVDVGCHDLVDILLKRLPDPQVLTISLENSIRRGEESLARLLVKSKATTTNALHIAAAFGQESMLSLCYDITANLYEENEGGFAAIHCACEGGYLRIVEKLLDHGVGADLESSVTGQSPLHIACQFGHFKIIEHLLGKGVDPIKKDKSGLTPLHTAIKWQQIGSVRALFEKQSLQQFNMLATDENGYTALHFAAESSRIDITDILLAALKDMSANGDEDLGNQLGEAICKNSTPLHIAASTGSSEVVKALLLWAAEQDHVATLRVDAEGCIPLHLAAISGCPEIVKQLLQEYLKPEDQLIQRARNHQNAYPIHLAIKRHHYAVVKILLEAHSRYDVALDLFFKLAVTPLHMASTYGQLDIVKLLLKYNATANVVDWHDKTPLFNASEKGHLRIVQELLDYDADPNAADEQNTSPLLSAIRKNHIHVVKLLLDRDADPDQGDISGVTPILAASEVGHAHIVDLLLKYGADPNIEDDNGFSPLLIAAKNGHVEVVKLLFQNDITDLEIIGPDQKTILHFAAENGEPNTLEYILSHSEINPDVTDSNGNTPLHFISRKGLVDMVSQFLDHNASPTAMNMIGQAPVHLAPTEELMLMLLPSADDLKDPKFDSVLYRATELGYLNLLKRVQEDRGSLEAVDNKGCCLYHTAARIGHFNVFEFLIQLEVPGIDLEDKAGRTPISHAAEWGNLDIVQIVAEKAPQTVRSPDRLKRTPLFHAAGNGQLNVVTYLLQDTEASLDIDSTDSQGQTPLWLAASRGYAPTAEFLVHQHADTTIANEEDGWTPLHCAAQLDKREIIKLLSGIEDLRDIQDKEGRTALFLAAYAGNKEVVKELLGKGAADLSDERGWITLHAAHDNPAILKMLLERPDVNVNAKANGGETALHLACASNRDLDSVKLLMQRGADPLQKDSENVTPLHIAATCSYEDSAIRSLLNNIQGPLNIKDNNLQTPLMLAIKRSNTSAVELLLKAQGLELGVSGEEEDAIIGMAVAQSDRKVVELILEHGRSNLSTASIEAFLIWAIKENADPLSRSAIEILSERPQELTRHQELIELVWENDNIPLASFLSKFESSKDIRDSHNWVLEQIISAFQPPIEEGRTVLSADSQHLSPSRWDPVRTSQGLELLDPEAHCIYYRYQRWGGRRFLTAVADHPVPLSSKFYFEIEMVNGSTDE